MTQSRDSHYQAGVDKPGTQHRGLNLPVVSISSKPYVKHLFNLHNKLLFPNYRWWNCCTPIYPQYPIYLLVQLIPPSECLFCCFIPSILTALVQPSFFSLPRLTRLPASGHLLWHPSFRRPPFAPRLWRAHTHTCYISSPFPQSIMSKRYCMVFQNNCSSHPPASPWPSVPSASMADLAQFCRTQLAATADAHPLSQPQALLPHCKAQMKCHRLCGAFLISLFFHKTLLLIIDISVHLCDG